MSNNEKSEFISLLKERRTALQRLLNQCARASGKQVQARSLLESIEQAATSWFEVLEPALRSTYALSPEVLEKARGTFGKLLELSSGRPSKQVVIETLQPLVATFHHDFVIPVQTYNRVAARFPKLDVLLTHSVGLEIDYLTEAIDCANLSKLRAAVILGWCAAVNRMHLLINQQGFEKFNHASLQMSAIQTGRYKRFNKKFDIQNLSDFRMSVFDNDLLWVLEFMGIVDGNEHEKLEICFTLRNTCAHPGNAVVTPENVLSFFSDIDALVLNNPKFTLSLAPA